MAPSPLPHSRRFEYFRAAGEIASSVAEMALGGSGEMLGTVLDAAGVGSARVDMRLSRTAS